MFLPGTYTALDRALDLLYFYDLLICAILLCSNGVLTDLMGEGFWLDPIPLTHDVVEVYIVTCPEEC